MAARTSKAYIAWSTVQISSAGEAGVAGTVMAGVDVPLGVNPGVDDDDGAVITKRREVGMRRPMARRAIRIVRSAVSLRYNKLEG